MAALAAERNTKARSGDTIVLAMAAAVLVYAGSLVARDALGNATPGATAVGLVGLGRARETVDNSLGLAGDQAADIEKGVFLFDNDPLDAVTVASIGANCFITDDQTVAATDGGATKSVAGVVFDVDAGGVWVDFR
ncbi:hypothetical protein [Desulfocastanea catecholica]